MSETAEQRERRLRSIPDNFENLGADIAQMKYIEHMTFSLWRIANQMEKDARDRANNRS